MLLTITKLQCTLESKQERIAALERQVEDLMQDRKFLRTQIENLTSSRSMQAFAPPTSEGLLPAPSSLPERATLVTLSRLSRSPQTQQGAAFRRQVPEKRAGVLQLVRLQPERLRGVGLVGGFGRLRRTPEEEAPQGEETVEEGEGLHEEER